MGHMLRLKLACMEENSTVVRVHLVSQPAFRGGARIRCMYSCIYVYMKACMSVCMNVWMYECMNSTPLHEVAVTAVRFALHDALLLLQLADRSPIVF